MRGQGRPDHAETNRKAHLVRRIEALLELDEQTRERLREPSTAVFGRPADPTEPSIEYGSTPRSGCLQQAQLRRRVVEEAYRVAACAPGGRIRRAYLGVGTQECRGL